MNSDELESALTRAEIRVLKIQAKLHRWASDEPHGRFDDLFNLVTDPGFLLVAWDRVRHDKGARTAGVDGETARYIEAVCGVEGFLTELREDLKARAFRPLPVRRRAVPKAGGKVRCSRTSRRYHLRHELRRTNTPSPAPRPINGTLFTGFLDRHRETVVRKWPGSPTRSCARERCPRPASPCSASCGRGRSVVAPDGDRRRKPGGAARLRVPSSWGDNRFSCCCLGPKALVLSN